MNKKFSYRTMIMRFVYRAGMLLCDTVKDVLDQKLRDLDTVDTEAEIINKDGTVEKATVTSL